MNCVTGMNTDISTESERGTVEALGLFCVENSLRKDQCTNKEKEAIPNRRRQRKCRMVVQVFWAYQVKLSKVPAQVAFCRKACVACAYDACSAS